MTHRQTFYLIVVVFLSACSGKERIVDISQQALIPKPVSITPAAGSFELSANSVIRIKGESPELLRLGSYLASKLKPATGFELPVSATGDPAAANSIVLSLDQQNGDLGDEGYSLTITEGAIELKAGRPEGLFRGFQTLLQLLPDAISGTAKAQGPWKVGAGVIMDHPSYPMRGAMLDVSRHFFGMDDVKRYIDLISFYKMNTLHLHLSDDQGWRIEIKSWPDLAKIGGSTQVGGGKGGFYTQEQYKELVAYAQDRYITIIPEIDMPGHINAAMASYPALNCNDSATALYTQTEVGFSSFCVKKDITYKFVEDVVRELAAITPGPYIHLGGDESHSTAKEDYLAFVNKIQAFPKKYGKQMIGWEEIAQSNLDSSTVVQSWDNETYGKEAAAKGARLIMSPAKKAYLDMKYDSSTKLGLSWAGLIEVDSSYIWALSSRIPGVPRAQILGVEAPLWTETITNMNEIEYMVFPRLAGLAEVGWSPEEGRSWDEYKLRLAKHGPRMKALDIDFYASKLVPWVQ